MDPNPLLAPAVAVPLIVLLGALVFALAAMFVRARGEFQQLEARKEDLRLALLERSASLEEAVQRAEEANRRVQNLERFDGLTGLPNQATFLEAVDLEWRRGRREKMPMAVVLVAVDAFADFDRTFGSGKGDECLRRVAAVLSTGLFRAGDVVGRWREERFAILLPWTGTDGAETVARRLASDLSALAIPRAGTVPATVTMSAGIAAAVPGKGPFDELLTAAEAALEEALGRGPGQVVTSAAIRAAAPVTA